MLGLILLCTAVLSGDSFVHLARTTKNSHQAVQMSAQSRAIGAVLIASSMLSMPVFAKEGEPAKISIFGNNDMSSPFSVAEVREDPIYSPYSPYGNGEKAVYKKGTPEEIKFYTGKFEESVKRVSKIPSYVSRKTWSEITTELTRFTNNIRESMMKLAEASPNPRATKKAADKYFQDLEEMFVFGTRKDASRVTAAYDRSVADLAAYRSLLQ